MALLLPWLLLLTFAYSSFTYPIKQDRYQHSFFRHLRNRAEASLYLLRSPARRPNTTVRLERLDEIIRDTAVRHGVHPCLVRAVVMFESGYHANTITTTGAMGLMALMPETARSLEVGDPFNPEDNIDGGTRLLKQLLATFRSRIDLALAGYNAGEEAVIKRNAVPPLRETVDYVAHVTALHDACRRHHGS